MARFVSVHNVYCEKVSCFVECSVVRPIRSFCGPSLFLELQYRSLYLCSTVQLTIVLLY